MAIKRSFWELIPVSLRQGRGAAASRRIRTHLALARLLPLGLAACSTSGDSGGTTRGPEKDGFGNYNPAPDPNSAPPSGIFGTGGLFGGGKSKDEGGGGIGVNSFLWRATLDTISFMPLASADPFGGVIITDWYNPAQTPNERFKVTVYILDRSLRADGLRVSVFKQVRQGAAWLDQPAAPETGVSMENAILQRARELRVESEARR